VAAEPGAVRVKICGLTRAEDAATAVRLGADWLGVIFAGGPRLIDADRAAEIVRAASGRPVFGVFGSQSAEEILRVRDRSGLAGAQLHGSHHPELAVQLGREGLRVIEVARLARQSDLDHLPALATLAVPVLVEPRVAGALGGTGASLPLALALAARDRLRGVTMVLAGGLTPETVALVLSRVAPDAVDVSSGVEQIPGVKDPERIARFMEAVGGHNAAA
jgi:phosphoribosylanthranilate isomerase